MQHHTTFAQPLTDVEAFFGTSGVQRHTAGPAEGHSVNEEGVCYVKPILCNRHRKNIAIENITQAMKRSKSPIVISKFVKAMIVNLSFQGKSLQRKMKKERKTKLIFSHSFFSNLEKISGVLVVVFTIEWQNLFVCKHFASYVVILELYRQPF